MRLPGAALVTASVIAAMLAGGVPAASAETPAPSPSPSRIPCGAPAVQAITAEPSAIAPGDTATVTITNRQYPCRSGDEPVRRESLIARPAGTTGPPGSWTTMGEADTDSYGTATFTVAPTSSTEYSFSPGAARFDGTYSVSTVITVNRYSGSCAGVVSLNGPATAPIGAPVLFNGTAPDTATVNILFRKRGQTTFQVRRSITPRDDRTFSVGFYADDDYRLYASSTRCDSPPVLVQAKPTISGPSTVRAGSSVTLLVRAPAGSPVKVYFRRAGATTFQLGRMGAVRSNGRYVTTYSATADHRYYSVTGNDRRQSNLGLTQVR